MDLQHNRVAALFHAVSLFVLVFSEWGSVSGSDICIELTASFRMASPDGVLKEIIVLNDQFPGPTIRVRKWDSVTIRVRNNLRNSAGLSFPTSVHFHGIEMRGSPWYDGSEGVAQCPIPYGSVMNYSFSLEQSGTYWYHSHHSWQYIDGFWGLFIVENEPEVHAYDDELILTLADWHHRSGAVLEEQVRLPRSPSNPEAGWPPIPDSALINGHGNADCEMAASSSAHGHHHHCDPEQASLVTIFDVEPGRTYRIRVVNPSARANFLFSIDGHKLRAIETDGVDTAEASPVDQVELWPAQRYSFLVKMDKEWPGGNAWIRAKMVVEHANASRLAGIVPLAALHYRQQSSTVGGQKTLRNNDTALRLLLSSFRSRGGGSQGRVATITPHAVSLTRSIPVLKLEGWRGVGNVCSSFVALTENRDKSQKARISREYLSVFSNQSSSSPIILNQSDCRAVERGGALGSPPNFYDKEIVLTAQFEVDGENRVHGHMNGGTFNLQASGGIPAVVRVRRGEDPLPDYFRPVETPHLGQVVQLVVNSLDGGHPWHLHGHTFWVLGTGKAGDGPYNKTKHEAQLDIRGLRRDTTHTPPNSWTVLRYRVDNPGVWLFHCHVHWHLAIGLAAVFVEVPRQLANLEVPEEARRICGSSGVEI